MTAAVKPKYITFINEGGAVHTVEVGLFNRKYKGRVLKLGKAVLAKLAANSDKVAEFAEIRVNAVLENGQPDNKARAQAARDWQKAHREATAYRMSLVSDDD